MDGQDTGSGPSLMARLRPWLIWAAGALFFCYGFFHRVSTSVMTDDLMRDFGMSGAVLGNLSALYFYAYASVQLPAGVLVDRFGARRVLTVAAMVCASGSVLFGMADSLSMAFAGRLLIGLGAGFALIGAFKLGTVWFPAERFAFVTGLTAMLGSAGALLGQAPLAGLIAVTGWRPALIGVGLFGFILAAGIWISAREPKADPASPAPKPAALANVFQGIGSVLSTIHNWAVALILLSMVIPMLAFAALWGVPFMMEAYGLDRPTAGSAMSAFILGHGAGAPFMGWLSDRLRRRKLLMIIGSSTTLLSMLVVIYLTNLPLLVIYVVLLVGGVTSGATMVCFAVAREYNRAERSGTALGFVNLLNILGAALFQPFIGWLLDLTWDGRMEGGARVYTVEGFQTALIGMIVVSVLGTITAMLVRETHCRPLEGR